MRPGPQALWPQDPGTRTHVCIYSVGETTTRGFMPENTWLPGGFFLFVVAYRFPTGPSSNLTSPGRHTQPPIWLWQFPRRSHHDRCVEKGIVKSHTRCRQYSRFNSGLRFSVNQCRPHAITNMTHTLLLWIMCVLLIITILAVCCHRLVLWKTFLSTFTMFRSNVSPAVRAYSLSCKVQVVVVYWFRRRCLCSVRHIWTLATISDYENTIAWSRQFREVSSAKYSGKHNKHT